MNQLVNQKSWLTANKGNNQPYQKGTTNQASILQSFKFKPNINKTNKNDP
jgi:hypothetical protein